MIKAIFPLFRFPSTVVVILYQDIGECPTPLQIMIICGPLVVLISLA